MALVRDHQRRAGHGRHGNSDSKQIVHPRWRKEVALHVSYRQLPALRYHSRVGVIQLTKGFDARVVKDAKIRTVPDNAVQVSLMAPHPRVIHIRRLVGQLNTSGVRGAKTYTG